MKLPYQLLLFFIALLSSFSHAGVWHVFAEGGKQGKSPLDVCINISYNKASSSVLSIYPSDSFTAGSYRCQYIYHESGLSQSKFIVYFAGSAADPANEACDVIDNQTFGCASSNPCLDIKPITSSTNAQTACYNQCGYTTLGGFRDYDNALAPIAYEYLPTGEVCTGNEETSQLAGVSEYTEINEEELDCRSDPGVQVCISEDKSCKIVNGYPVCFDEATNQDELNCGTFNGEVVCFEKNAFSNCQYVNGEYLCTYPEGDKVDPDSVDHPINGGNANGQTHDDILDQQDLTENSPEAQSVKQIVKETGIRQQAEKQAESDNPSSSIAGLGCDKEVSCTGDAIQCAIARMQKKQLCLSEFNEGDINSIISGNDQMSPLGTLPGDTLEIHVDDFLDTEEYVSSDSQCPDSATFTLLGTEHEFVLTPLCDLASYISWFIQLTTWFSMSVILAKSLGNG